MIDHPMKETEPTIPRPGSILRWPMSVAMGLPAVRCAELWDRTEGRTLAELGFPPDTWRTLARERIYPEDPLNGLLSTALGYFTRVLTADEFDHLRCAASRILGLGEGATDLKPPVWDPRLIIPRLSEGVGSLPVLPSLAGGWVSEFASFRDIRQMAGLSVLSDRIVLRALGFCGKAVILIEQLWALRLRLESLDNACYLLDQLGAHTELTNLVINAARRAHGAARQKLFWRNIEIYLRHNGLWDGNQPTLRMTGDRFDITGCRIGEIVERVVVRKFDVRLTKALLPLVPIIDVLLGDTAGSVSLNQISLWLTSLLGWTKPPDPRHLAAVIDFLKIRRAHQVTSEVYSPRPQRNPKQRSHATPTVVPPAAREDPSVARLARLREQSWSLNSNVVAMSLSTSELEILTELGIHTIGHLLSQDLTRLYLTTSLGRARIRELRALQWLARELTESG